MSQHTPGKQVAISVRAEPKEGYFFTNDDLRYLQSLELWEKVQKTQAKIIEWCKHWEWNVYVSFSGGKDSTVLLDLASRVAEAFGKEIPAVFCDTGLEYPEIREFVKSFGKRVTWIKPKKSFKSVIEEHGYPVISKDVARKIEGSRKGSLSAIRHLSGQNSDGTWSKYCESTFVKYQYLLDAPFKISDKCCDVLKKSPFRTYEKETGRKCITAMMAFESRMRRDSYLRHGCNAFDSKRPISNPMGFWTEQDVLKFLKEFEIPIAQVYGELIEDKKGKLSLSGLDRTGCTFCMFGIKQEKSPNRFQRMKATHPNLYRYCMNQLGCKDVLEFIGVEH